MTKPLVGMNRDRDGAAVSFERVQQQTGVWLPDEDQLAAVSRRLQQTGRRQAHAQSHTLEQVCSTSLCIGPDSSAAETHSICV